LRDVEYIIKAQIDLKPHVTDNVAKYRDQFRRRVARGQCFNQPYLGTREFSAAFCPVTGNETPISEPEELDLGWMLFDIEFTEIPKKGNISYYTHDVNGARITKGMATPKFFHATLHRGVLTVPQELYTPIVVRG
jgi:CRISPR-associated protein Cas5d